MDPLITPLRILVLGGISPFLDPTKPISHDHIKRVAEDADIPTDSINDTVSSLSAHISWDITKGSAR
ncbi:hypothetical protein ACFL30_00125 [Candidatus Latescibacterota bacterium]